MNFHIYTYEIIICCILLFSYVNLIYCDDYFSDIVKTVFSSNKSYDANSDCVTFLEKYLEELKLNKKWALYMSDATVKQIPGDSLLEGNWMLAGSYDQCISIKANIGNTSQYVWGKYCTIEYPIRQLVPSSDEDLEINIVLNETESDLLQSEYIYHAVNITAGICVPHICSSKQISDLLQLGQEENGFNFNFSISKCHTKAPEQKPLEDKFDVYDWTFIGFLITIILILAGSTLYEFEMEKSGTKIQHKWFTTFSIISNGRSLFALQNTQSLSCLAGIRVISTLWIVLHHMTLVYGVVPLRNAIPVLGQGHQTSSLFISNAIMSVDTFFCLSGIVMVYSFMRSNQKGEGFNILKHYVHRYIRITPALAAELFLHVSLLRHLGSGPVWPRVESILVNNCQKSWWAVLLHIQNFISPSQLCMLQSWYISTDFQLYLLSPIVLLPIKYWGKKMKIAGLILGFCVAIGYPFYVAYYFSIHGLQHIAILKNPYYYGWYYENVAARCGPWVVGIWLGYLLFHRESNVLINHWLEKKAVYWIGMTISVGILVLITFGPVLLYDGYNRLYHSIFLATHRILWAFAIAFIVYACTSHPKSIINRFLSHPSFQILSRLTYCIYILHVLLFFLKMGIIRQPQFGTPWQAVHDFLGTSFDTIVLSIIWTLAFELPFMRIDKLIFRPNDRSSTNL